MQRMDVVVGVDRPRRRHQRLSGDLPAEGALEVARERTTPPVDVGLDPLDLEYVLDGCHADQYSARG